ncbi:MAG: shikimate kinase [Firmicutes bacterium]|nr:shikimate kinase [Lachnospiraceae bacterium]MDD6065026.1 shikimate kinase [Bacillota bacterium]MDY2820560.1 shikimate kinase [Hominisplanchenecus sp.]
MENIVLIGMPGSGKSTVGVVLAKVMGYQFIDSDLEIQRQEGKRLPFLIEEHGIDGFIEIEERVNAELQAEYCVIATGGSVVYAERAMKHLKEIGTVVYLKLSYEQLKERLGDLRCRGVVLRENQTLEGLYEERVPLYEKYADITIDETGLNVEQTMEKIVECVNKID